MREIVLDTETTGFDHNHVGAGGMTMSDTPSTPVRKINETNRIATDIDTSIPDFLKRRKKGDEPKPHDQNAEDA
jgi:hypothetical protein